jgi:hypothetical protein
MNLGRWTVKKKLPIFVIPQLWFFIPLWKRGIKGDFKNMFGKAPTTPLRQRGV